MLHAWALGGLPCSRAALCAHAMHARSPVVATRLQYVSCNQNVGGALAFPRATPSENLDNAGQLHLGGISTTALRATSGSVTTPLTPNLWRNDFYNGSNNYVSGRPFAMVVHGSKQQLPSRLRAGHLRCGTLQRRASLHPHRHLVHC